jgi:hypothetical protein
VDEPLGPSQAGRVEPAGGGATKDGLGMGHRAAPWAGTGAGECSERGWGTGAKEYNERGWETGAHAWAAMDGEQWWAVEDGLGEAQGFPDNSDFGIRHGTGEVTRGLDIQGPLHTIL